MTDTWSAGASADWSNASDWSGGIPSSSSTVNIGGSAAYLLTLTGSGTCAALTLNAANAQFYVSGALTLGGMFALQAGQFTLSGGSVSGGTLAMAGGSFLSAGGIFNGMVVDGALSLSQANATLFVENGLTLAGATGSGAGSLAITGAYASVDFLGSQTLANATVTLGASGYTGAASLQIGHMAGATSGATLTLGSGVSVQDTAGQGQIVVGTLTGGLGALPDALVNNGLITTSGAGATLAVLGSGTLVNQGTIAASNGAEFDIGAQGFTNTGVISVNNATLGLTGTFSTALFGSLGSVTLTNATVALDGDVALAGGTLALGGSSAITGSLGALSLTGEISGGTVQDAGGGLAFTSAAGTLDSVTYRGTLSLAGNGAGVTLADGSKVTGGSIAVTGAGAALMLQGSETLNGVTIALGNAAGLAALGTADAFLASTATTATLGTNTVLQQVGAIAALEANGFSPFAGIGLDDTLVNAGTINAGIAGGTLAVSGYGTFINQGSIAVSGGDTLLDTASVFANAGTLSVGNGATAVLGATSGIYGQSETWSNAGLLLAAGGTLALEGSTSTAALGSISESGSGVVLLEGTLNNAGATLTLGTASGLTDVVLAGTISGGTIADASGALSAASGAMLQSVAYNGTLALTNAGAALEVAGGLSVSGGLRVTGSGAEVLALGSETIAAPWALGAIGGATVDVLHSFSAPGASILTLAASGSINQAGQSATIGTAQQLAGDGIVNKGHINAGYAGGTLLLGGQSFSNTGTIAVSNGDTLEIGAAAFSNTGIISVNNASLLVAGNVSLASLGQLSLNNATLGVSGTLGLGGGTLGIGTGTAWGAVALNGTIASGIIADSGGGLIDSGAADLSGITYEGTLDLSRPFASLSFSQGLTVLPAAGAGAGSILLTGAQSRLIASSSETLSNCTITIGSAAQYYGNQRLNSPELAAAAAVQLTLGAGALVNATGMVAQLGDLSLGNWSDEIVNQGMVNTSLAGNTLTLDSTVFDNLGEVAAAGGAVLWVSDASLINAGTLSFGHGAVAQVSLYNYFSAPNAGASVLTNSGTMLMSGGTVHEMTANGLFPSVPFINMGSGQILGNGAVLSAVNNNGLVQAIGGQLTIGGTVSGNGSLLIGQGATLDLTAGVSAGETISFNSSTGTLMLNQPALFDGAIANYTTGDIIDLPGQTMTFLAASNGTLAVNSPVQQFLLPGATPFAGAVAGGPDGHGGSMIDQYLPHGGSSNVLAVTEPNMLFWTTPSGQVLTGPSADFRGAKTCNWSNYSSLDVTDLNPNLAQLTVTEGSTNTTLTATDGTHGFTMIFSALITPSLFHVGSDGHLGSFITT